MAKKTAKVAEIVSEAEVSFAASVNVDAPMRSVPTAETLPLAHGFRCVLASEIEFPQERTKLSQTVSWIVFAMPKDDVSKRGNGIHQFGKLTRRTEGCVAVMPSRKLFEETGNPYPNDINDATVILAKNYEAQYRKLVALAYEITALLAKSPNGLRPIDLIADADLFARASERAKKTITRPQMFGKSGEAQAVSDTFRDLEHVGLAIACDAKRNGKTIWQPTKFLIDALSATC